MDSGGNRKRKRAAPDRFKATTSDPQWQTKSAPKSLPKPKALHKQIARQMPNKIPKSAAVTTTHPKAASTGAPVCAQMVSVVGTTTKVQEDSTVRKSAKSRTSKSIKPRTSKTKALKTLKEGIVQSTTEVILTQPAKTGCNLTAKPGREFLREVDGEILRAKVLEFKKVDKEEHFRVEYVDKGLFEDYSRQDLHEYLHIQPGYLIQVRLNETWEVATVTNLDLDRSNSRIETITMKNKVRQWSRTTDDTLRFPTRPDLMDVADFEIAVTSKTDTSAKKLQRTADNAITKSVKEVLIMANPPGFSTSWKQFANMGTDEIAKLALEEWMISYEHDLKRQKTAIEDFNRKIKQLKETEKNLSKKRESLERHLSEGRPAVYGLLKQVLGSMNLQSLVI